MNKLKQYILTLASLCALCFTTYAQEHADVESDTITSIQETTTPYYIKYIEEQNNAKQSYVTSNDSTIELSKFAPNFKDKYRADSDFNYTLTEHDSAWKALKRWFYDLLDSFFNQFEYDRKTDKNINTLFKYSGYVVIIFFFYYLIRAYLQKDLYWFVKKRGKKIQIKVDEIEQNLESIHFPTLLTETEQNKDYRLAVRYYYLWLLQVLQERKYIKWHIEKTNSDYVREIKDTAVKHNFEYLSYIYNNIWYGEQPIDIIQFEKAKTSFMTTLKPTKNE